MLRYGQLCLVIAASILCGLNAHAKKTPAFVPDELTCGLVDSAYIDTINATYGTYVKAWLPNIGSFLLGTMPSQNPESLSAVIALDAKVVYCNANYLLDAPEPVQGSQPFIDLVGSPDAWLNQPAADNLGLAQAQTVSTGSNVRVGVIDVGVNQAHPVLQNSVINGKDYVDGDTLALDEPGGSASGHGTFVAGVIALVAPEAEICAYRVLDTAGTGNGYTIADAILQAVADGCKVINLSMVLQSVTHGTVDLAIEYARDNDVLVVAAAGNDSMRTDLFPAKDSYTLSVASVDSLNRKSAFSNYGSKIDVCAPGTNIYAPYLDTTYAYWDGTSFAAPFVAGQAALLFASRPDLTWNDIVDAITLSAINIDSLNPEFSGDLGHGLIAPLAALNQVQLACGDINGSGGDPDIGDLTLLIDYLFISQTPLAHPELAEFTQDGTVDIGDLTVFIDFLFISGTSLHCAN
ncbi:MAG: hypothetical protein D6800_14790 [Candidatus Zixiibacteriota bacterium]|nr:MAG: hypothetical protein D6800_14790 [candidate division Zixibacteria bacterium]